MSERSVGILLIGLVIAGVLGLVLFTGAAGARGPRAGDVDPRVFFGDRPPPAARTIAQLEERVPGAVRPIVPVQRQIALAFRDAAGYLLILLGVAASLVFARGPVLAGYRATHGGWRAHLRLLALGGALLAVVGSALFLMFISMLGVVAGPQTGLGTAVGVASGRGGFVLGPAPLLEVGVTAIAVAIVLVAIVVIVGLAAASWRLGDWIVSLRPLSRLGQGTPPTLIALLGASLVYLVSQLPVIGPVVLVGAVAYALGIVAAARLGPAAAAPVA